jgi:hypothetical protein
LKKYYRNFWWRNPSQWYWDFLGWYSHIRTEFRCKESSQRIWLSIRDMARDLSGLEKWEITDD